MMSRECRGEDPPSAVGPHWPGPWALLLLVASVAAVSFPGCLNLPAPYPTSPQIAWRSREPAPGPPLLTATAAAPTGAGSTPRRDGSSGPAKSIVSGAEGPKAVSPPGDPSVAKTSSGPAPLGSPVPPPGPVPDIMTPVIPTSGVELPIDLPTALRLAERENPVIGEARARIGEALGRQQKALVELVPMLNAGASYNGHNGVLQQSTGHLINVSRQAVYVGGGAGVDGPGTPLVPAVGIIEPLADAIYDPLAARQRVNQARFDASATANTVLLEVASYYLELLAATAKLEAQRRSAQEAADLTQITERYAQFGEGRPYDADRARTEWRIRRADVRRAEEEKAIVSARLCRRLHLDPSTQIRPVSNALAILALVDLNTDLPSLLQAALLQRPEVKAAAANLAATKIQWKKAVARPLLPLLYLGFSGAAFGGGSNLTPPLIGNFASRVDFDVAAYWTLDNLGFGNAMQQKQRRAQVGEATGQQSRVINLVRDQVASAYGDARAQREQVEIDRVELETAMEGFRRDIEQMLGAVTSGKVRAPRPIEVLNSLTLLARARLNLIRSITAYDQSQFRLFVALGSPPPLDQPADPTSPAVPIGTFSALVANSRPGQQPADGPGPHQFLRGGYPRLYTLRGHE